MSTPTPRPGTPGAERSIGQLVADASQDVAELVRHEIALAKAEITADVKNGALAGGLFGAAGFLGVVAFVLLCVAAAYALVALGLSPWLSFLIVAVLLLLVAGVLGLAGRGRLSRVRPPERTLRTTKDTVAVLKAGASGNSRAAIGGQTPEHPRLGRAAH